MVQFPCTIIPHAYLITVLSVPDVQLRVDSSTDNSITIIPSGPSGNVSYKEYGSISPYTGVKYFNRIVISQLKPNTQYAFLYALANDYGTGTAELTHFTLPEGKTLYIAHIRR